ncbi:MAG: FtsL-like putative cell division protein [Saprospiraceae bacterium]
MAKKKSFQLSDLGHLTTGFILKNLPFLAFLGFLAIVYIANSHYAERSVLRIQLLQQETKELRWYYMSLQSENMFNSMQSEVADRVRSDGIRLQRGKPKKIIVK